MGGEAPFESNKDNLSNDVEIKPTLGRELQGTDKPNYIPSIVGIALGLLGVGILGEHK